MKTAPTKLEQLAAIAILVCATALIVVFVVLPMSMTIRETHDQIAHNQALISRLSAHANAPNMPEADLASLQSRILRENRYLQASTEPLAAAALQQHIKALLSEFGASALSIRNIPKPKDDTRRSVALRVAINTEAEQLVEFIYALETETPFVIVDNIKITSGAWRRQLANQPAEDALSVEFNAVAFMPPWEAEG